MSTVKREQTVFAETYGGVFGGMMPVLAMITGIIILSALGMRSTVNLWSAGYLAPISDTTIASSLTQEVSVIKVVKSRLKYSVAGGAAAAVAFVIAGMSTVNASGASSLNVDSTYASSLIFLILPALVVIMMLKKANFFTAVFITSLLGLVMLLVFGYVDFTGLVAKEGLIVSAFSGNLNAIIFMKFIFMSVNLVKEAGVLDALMKKILKYAKSEQSIDCIGSYGMYHFDCHWIRDISYHVLWTNYQISAASI